jgi:predicted tellurium resistance membrane protein TerC
MDFLAAFLRDFEAFGGYAAWASLATLTGLELVLGIDNIVFLSIITGALPEALQRRVRTIGLSLALLLRIAVLFAISSIMRMQEPLVTVPIIGRGLSGRDLILLGGGLFLMFKATREIHARIDEAGRPPAASEAPRRSRRSVVLVVLQIMVIDVVFSLDSIVTAVGVADHLAVMVCAMVIAVVGMMIFAGPVGSFINRRPSMKILALSFLLLIGLLLVAEAFGQKIDRGYLYFAMTFSVLVELLNSRLRKRGHSPAPK